MNILDQLFEDGVVVKQFTLSETPKITAKLRTLTTEKQLQVEEQISQVKGTGKFLLHTYSLSILSVVLVSYNGRPFSTEDEALTFIKQQPSLIVNKLVKCHQDLENELAKALGLIEEIKENFSPGVDQTQNSEPLPAESKSTPETNSEKV